MKKEIEIAPPNSLILIMDKSIGEIPMSMNDQLISFADTCIAVGTLSKIDGETCILVTDEYISIDKNLLLKINHIIETPSKVISILTTTNIVLFETGVTDNHSRIKVWANHDTEPDKIVISIGEQ